MRSSYLRFALLFALLLLGRLAAHAQSAPAAPDAQHTVTGFGDPEPLDPRYAAANELTELKTQMQTLLHAYEQLVTRYNAQATRLQALERQQALQQPVQPNHRNRALRANALSGSY